MPPMKSSPRLNSKRTARFIFKATAAVKGSISPCFPPKPPPTAIGMTLTLLMGSDISLATSFLTLRGP